MCCKESNRMWRHTFHAYFRLRATGLLIIFLVGLLAFVKRLFGHLSLRPLRISSTGSRCPFSSRSTSWTWHHLDDSAFLARGKYSIITNTYAFLLQVVRPMWPATEMADCYFHPWCVHVEVFVCYLWPAEKILFLVALIAWTVCNWRRFSCFVFFVSVRKLSFKMSLDNRSLWCKTWNISMEIQMLCCIPVFSSNLQYSPVISSIHK